MAPSAGDVWAKILAILREDLPDRTVQNWFENASPEIEGSDPRVLRLTLPSTFHCDHVRDRYYSELREASKKVLQREMQVELEAEDKLEGSSRRSATKPAAAATKTRSADRSSRAKRRGRGSAHPTSPQSRTTEEETDTSSRSAGDEHVSSAPTHQSSGESPPSRPMVFHRSRVRHHLKARYTFDNFVQGDSNALARSASSAVADDPGGTNYNPLLIYGGVGLGKTHLAQAIANHAIRQGTAEYVCYKSGEAFTSEFVQSIRQGEGDKFSKKYKGVDLLILDDIQFFEEKEKTQEEFFHLFNSLYQKGKQIVLCADRPPKEIEGIEDRLLSRFEWGLSTDVQQPTLETRLAILQLKADELELDLEPAVLDLMAESITTNVRALEGALKQLSARASLIGTKIDTEAARQILEDQVQLPKSTPISAEDVLNAVTAYYSISHEDLTGRSRRKELVHSRHIAMYLCRELCSHSLSAIGLRFDGRDHSTVSYACEKVTDRLDVEPDLERELKDVKREIHRYAAR